MCGECVLRSQQSTLCEPWPAGTAPTTPPGAVRKADGQLVLGGCLTWIDIVVDTHTHTSHARTNKRARAHAHIWTTNLKNVHENKSCCPVIIKNKGW